MMTFQAITPLTVQENMNLASKFLQNESFFSFFLKWLNLNCTPKKDATIYIAWHHSFSCKHFISKKIVCFLKFKEILRFRKLWQMKIEISRRKLPGE